MQIQVVSFLQIILLFAFTTSCLSVFSQEKIEGTMTLMGQQKTYALYIPSTYQADQPNAMMLGLHPWNPNRWDAVSWRDTLTTFCEENGILLVCPDGGADGQVDDAIDTLLASRLVDSVQHWYNIDPDRMYVMGFSWGARTLFTYGLVHAGEFDGFIPIGTAISSLSDIDAQIGQAVHKPFYVIHGENDAPQTRFYPVVDALVANDACVETRLMSNVGHTIDFPDRNAILTMAYQWIDSVSCGTLRVVETDEPAPHYYPNPVEKGHFLHLDLPEHHELHITLFSIDGQVVGEWENVDKISTETMTPGMYTLSLRLDDSYYFGKVMVR